MDAEILRKRENSENCPSDIFKYVVTMTRHMFVCLAHVNTCLTHVFNNRTGVFDTSYCKMDDEKSENAKNSENCPAEIFTCQICGYDDRTHVCMVWQRKHMCDTRYTRKV